MNKLWRAVAPLLMVSMVSTATLPAFADPPSPTQSDVGQAVSPMKKGQTAPFTGVLVSPESVAKIAVELKSIPDQIKIEVDKANADASAKCTAQVNAVQIKADADAKVAQARLNAALNDNKTLADRLKSEERNHTDKWLWAGGGALLGAGVTVLVVVLTK